VGISSVLVAAAAITLAVFTYSEPFAVAREFLLNSPCLNRAVGAVQSMRLSYLRKSGIKESAGKEYAFFTIYVRGKRARAIVEVKLVKAVAKWSITSAILEEGDSAGSSNDLLDCDR
jgi:hypothetical protein